MPRVRLLEIRGRPAVRHPGKEGVRKNGAGGTKILSVEAEGRTNRRDKAQAGIEAPREGRFPGRPPYIG